MNEDSALVTELTSLFQMHLFCLEEVWGIRLFTKLMDEKRKIFKWISVKF